jgi:hypothetical protein
MRCGFSEAGIGPSPDSLHAGVGDSPHMTVKIDIAEVSDTLASLHATDAHRTDRAHRSLAVVVPLAEGKRDVVREFLEEGPPFEPAEIGLESHKVFLNEHEAIFVFETEEGVKAFERVLAEPELWDLISSWEHCLADEPRLATAVYEWPQPRQHAPEP